MICQTFTALSLLLSNSEKQKHSTLRNEVCVYSLIESKTKAQIRLQKSRYEKISHTVILTDTSSLRENIFTPANTSTRH